MYQRDITRVPNRVNVMAVAAPASSMAGKPNQPKMKIGSKIKLTKAPMVIIAPGMLALPLARITLPQIMVVVNKMVPGR